MQCDLSKGYCISYSQIGMFCALSFDSFLSLRLHIRALSVSLQSGVQKNMQEVATRGAQLVINFGARSKVEECSPHPHRFGAPEGFLPGTPFTERRPSRLIFLSIFLFLVSLFPLFFFSLSLPFFSFPFSSFLGAPSVTPKPPTRPCFQYNAS